jgi:hypothetical protein
MPQKQSIMWTALPNGVKSGGSALQLSVFVSPRLYTDPSLPQQLSQFPDFQGWTTKVQGVQFAVQFQGGAAIPATVVGSALEPALWAALFTPTTYVQSYQSQDYSNSLVYSHPVGNVSAFLKSQYQKIGATSPTAHPPTSVLAAQLAPISLYEPPAAAPTVTARQHLMAPAIATKAAAKPAQKTSAKPAMRQVEIPSTLQNVVHNLQPHVQTSANRNLNSLLLRSLPVKTEAVNAFQSIYQDFQQYKAVRASATPQPTRDFLQVRLNYPLLTSAITSLQPPTIDFHKMLSTLGNYPQLMRALGLVIDLEIPIPSGVSTSTVKVIPTWSPNSPPSAFSTDFCELTACMVNPSQGQFYAQPASGSQIVNGMLNLSDGTSYPVVDVDVPGSALKMANLADRLTAAPVSPAPTASTTPKPMMLQASTAHPTATAPQTTTAPAAPQASSTTPLPALRTSGFSVAQTNRAQSFAAAMAKVAANNKALEANQPDQVTNYADDLVRGYRVDVWDSKSQTWHSLCQRKGTYNFFAANLTREYDDEGFVQLGVTQPVSGTTSGSQPPSDLYLQESMFTWNGWSLVAPLPGNTISPGGTPQAPNNPTVAPSSPPSGFNMVASFAVPPGTLPRLRFGTTYRIRARVVDLAGNSLAFNAPNLTDFSLATAATVYSRYEPVVAPAVVLTKTLDGTKSPGESLGRVVLRSNYDATAANYATVYSQLVSDPTYTGYTLRLIAPPQTSEQMAERHSMLDSPSGPMMSDPTTYQMIATLSGGAFPLDPQTRLPVQSSLTTPYLPDPLCQGASFAMLDSNNNLVATLPAVSFYPGGVTWPGAIPFLLKIVEGTGNTSWQWDAPSQTLTVQIAKAEVVTFNLSSLLSTSNLGAGNLHMMGVWNWIKEAAPANLAQLQQNIGAGSFWLLTPSRQIVIVHAVQQPLIAPQFHSLTPNRSLGETYSYIVDNRAMPIDGKSTVKVDFEAAWQEPLDDVSNPNGPTTLNGSAHVVEWDITPQQTAIEIVSAVALPAGPPAAALPAAKAPSKPVQQHVVAAPLVQQKAVTPATQALAATTLASAASLKAGTLIPIDVHAVRSPAELAALEQFGYSFRHDFGDTKYRKVNYSAVATTRFAEYFPIKDPSQLTRTSPTVAVDVPSSARPPRPSVLYAIPTFGWQKQTQVQIDKTGLKLGPFTLPGLKGIATVSQRSGGGLRIYLDRPWYGSGDGELLGVVLWPSSPLIEVAPVGLKTGAGQAGKPIAPKVAPGVGLKSSAAAAAVPQMVAKPLNQGAAVPDLLEKLVTQWGLDPVWQSNPLPQDLPNLENFPNAVGSGRGLTLDELANAPEPYPGAYQVGVAGYAPQYDKDRGLWYCDVEINFGDSYFPFIRLALVRYQPISVDDCHLSRVVQADIAQLAPDRSATVVYDPKNPKKLEVAIAGLSYAASAASKGPSVMEVTVEAKPLGADGDLGWVPVPEATITFGSQPNGTSTVWRGEVRLDRYKVPKAQQLRLVIREYETFIADATTPQIASFAVASPAQPVQRLVYADVLSIPPLT